LPTFPGWSADRHTQYTYCSASFESILTNCRTYLQINVDKLRAGGEAGESETGCMKGGTVSQPINKFGDGKM
jgi:hypothetical protein